MYTGKKRIFNLLLILFCTLCAFTQNEEKVKLSNRQCTLELELIGEEYEQIQLIVIDNHQVVHRIDGTKTGISNWKFAFSDSLYAVSSTMELSVPTNNEQSLHLINLHLLTQTNDTIRKNIFHISPNSKFVAVKYKRNTVNKFQFYHGKDVTFDSYIVSDEKNTDFTLAALAPLTRIDKKDTANYQSDLENFISIVKANKDSHFLLMELESSLLNFESKEDVLLVYEAFGDNMKRSIIGQKIYKYLYDKIFINMRLLNCRTGVHEHVLPGGSKFVLVLFSSSWCLPCHKQIPLLKKIYKDLAPDIEFVYISIDEVETVENWMKLMSDESIPWKSFVTLGCLSKVKETYFVQYIPFSYLVYPDHSFEIIDVRKETDQKKLYKLCGHSISDFETDTK